MAKVVQQRLTRGPEGGSPGRDLPSGEHEAYIPDALGGRSFGFDGRVAADVAAAEAAIIRFNLKTRAVSNSEALGSLLLRGESVASARLEGVEPGTRRLLRAEAARALGSTVLDARASEVLAHIDAMAYAVRAVTEGDPITPALLLETHRRLLVGSRVQGRGGRIREGRDWIGGSSFAPRSAAFVPPPSEMVGDFLVDLCEFCNGDALPALTQAAIAYAQFHTIHPFTDANGRVGRALIHMVLRRRGLASGLLPPVSLVLAAGAADYCAALAATRHLGSPASPEAHEGVDRWVGLLAAAATEAVAHATALEDRIALLEGAWRTYLGRVRRGSATDLLVSALPAAPVLTVQGAASLVGRSVQAANGAVARLEAAGVLRSLTAGRRNRVFEVPELIRAVSDLERRLARPA